MPDAKENHESCIDYETNMTDVINMKITAMNVWMNYFLRAIKEK